MIVVEKIKNKYEIILGFVTLVVSFSAFKDELKLITIDLWYTKITLSEYFLYCVFGFAFCLYLYIIEQIFRDTKYGGARFFGWLLKVAFFLFCAILTTPLVLFINFLVITVFNAIPSENVESKSIFSQILSLIAGILTLLTILQQLKFTRMLDSESKKMKTYHKAFLNVTDLQILISKGLNNNEAFIKLYELIENFIVDMLLQKGERVSINRFSELMKIAVKRNLINENELQQLKNSRAKRNNAIHFELELEKNDTVKILELAKSIIKKSRN